MAQSWNLHDVPDVMLVRWVDSGEWPLAQVECLQELGYAVRLTDDGQGIDFSDLPESQARKGSPLDAALYECEAKYSLDPKHEIPLNDAQLATLYDYFTQTLGPCLERRGVAVDAAPSLQRFIQDYANSSEWTPYESVDVANMSSADWNALNRDCPQIPTGNALFGEDGK